MNNSTDDPIAVRLDRLIAIMQLAFKDEIDKARMEIRGDNVSAAVLGHLNGEWIDAGSHKRRVVEETRQSERTVSRRIADLVSIGAIEQSGGGPSTRYRNAFLV